jgi:chemotaxis protein CheD
MTEIMVRIGELAVSRDAADELVSLGLGSCIGVAVVDGKYADRAIPALVARVRVPIVAHETGGSTARTIRVIAGTGRVTVRAAGSTQAELLGGVGARREGRAA